MVSLIRFAGVIALLSCLFSTLVSAEEAAPNKANDELGEELESIYLRWRKAIETKDIKEWVASSTRYSRVNIRNAIVSRKMKFPDAFFENPMRPPALEKLKHIHSIAVGDTAQSVYFGRVDFQLTPGDFNIPNSLFVLRFLKEADGWRFDSTQLMSMANMPDLEKKIIGGDYSFLDDDIFIPPGVAPKVPEQCPIPQVAGHFELVSIGYETSFSVNGYPQPSIANNGGSHIILGGLKSGFNKIEVSTRKIAPPVMEDGTRADSLLEIRIFALRGNIDDEVSELLYEFKPKTVKPKFMVQIRGSGD